MIGKAEVTIAMAEQSGLSKTLCRKVLDTYLNEVLVETMTNGNAVLFTNVGRFERVFKASRMGRNVKTKEPAVIKPRHNLNFNAVKPFRSRVMGMV